MNRETAGNAPRNSDPETPPGSAAHRAVVLPRAHREAGRDLLFETRNVGMSARGTSNPGVERLATGSPEAIALSVLAVSVPTVLPAIDLSVLAETGPIVRRAIDLSALAETGLTVLPAIDLSALATGNLAANARHPRLVATMMAKNVSGRRVERPLEAIDRLATSKSPKTVTRSTSGQCDRATTTPKSPKV